MFPEFRDPHGDDQSYSEGSTMSSVMIRCPMTGRAVSTAIETEVIVFRDLPNVSGRMLCPACGQEHVWPVQSAWLSDGPHPVDDAARLVPPGEAA